MIARDPSVRRREGREQSIEHIAGTVEDKQQTREEDPRIDAALAGAGERNQGQTTVSEETRAVSRFPAIIGASVLTTTDRRDIQSAVRDAANCRFTLSGESFPTTDRLNGRSAHSARHARPPTETIG
jgi:hypothetical protein